MNKVPDLALPERQGLRRELPLVLWSAVSAVFLGLAIWYYLAENDAWQVPSSVALSIFLAGLCLTYRRLYRAALLKNLRLEERVEWWRTRYLVSFEDERLEVFYGQSSRKRPIDRGKALLVLWEEVAAQVREGDYSRAAEVPPITRGLRGLLHKFYGQGLAERKDAEMEDIYERVHLYLRSLDIPLSSQTIPENKQG